MGERLRSWQDRRWWVSLLEDITDRGSASLVVAARDRGVTTPMPMPLRTGRSVLVRPDSTDLSVLHKVFVENEYRFPIPRPFTIIDAGAYVGYSTLWLHHEYPDAQIAAVEADPANFELLERNTAGISQIHCLHHAVWGEDVTVKLDDPGLGAWGMRVSCGAAGTAVQGVTVGALMKAMDWPRLDLLKLDIEGAEREVLASSDGWLSNCNALIAELHERFAPGSTSTFARATRSFAHGASRGENVARWRAPEG